MSEVIKLFLCFLGGLIISLIGTLLEHKFDKKLDEYEEKKNWKL